MKCTEEVSEYCREKIVVNKFAKEKICDECCMYCPCTRECDTICAVVKEADGE